MWLSPSLMVLRRWLLLEVILVVVAVLPLATGALAKRCGDCWCAPGSGSCPTDETGIVDTFDTEQESVLSTFELTNDPDYLKLQTSSGSDDCYPFVDSTGVVERNPQSQFPQCQIPTSTNETVCAFRYDPTDTVCAGRKYQVVTYDSEADAAADGAAVTHTGACGVCSSAQDFWIRIKEKNTLEGASVACALSYTLGDVNTRFATLVSCYEDVGFTTPCATLWAHYSAANGNLCSDDCFPDATGFTKLNEDDPPTCSFAPCLLCSATFQADFDQLAGRTFYKSGITERMIRPCDQFSRVEHDACVGTTERGEVVVPTSPPSAGPGPPDHRGHAAILLATMALLVVAV